MSNSRSIASVRQRRTGDVTQQMNSSRPVTSIASQSAFSPTVPNVRIAKAPIVEQQPPFQPGGVSTNGLPFTKLTVSDAIGLITLRLGKVEQYMIDSQVNGGTYNDEDQTKQISIDNSILTSIINRLDSLEKKQLNTVAISNTTSTVVDNITGEKISKLEKELRDTKDLLMSFIMKCDVLTRETGQRFSEIEGAIDEIEKFIQPVTEDQVVSTLDISKEIEDEILVENVEETNE